MAELIDRAALIQYVNSLSTHWLNSWDTAGVLDAVLKQPTVEAEPVVHARWMHDPRDISTFYAGDCSNCGCAPKRRTMSFKPWNYCPNCGARMDADAPERGKDGRDD